jgi:hypothetical protein
MPVDERLKAQLKKLLSSPELFPEEFKSFISGHVQHDPNIIWERSQIPTLPIEKITGSVNADKLDGLDSTDFLRLLAPATRKLAFGIATATFTGGSPAATVNVAHGLGVAPQVVLLTPQVQSGLNAIPAAEADTYGVTTFRATIWTIDNQSPVNTSTATFAWLAIA